MAAPLRNIGRRLTGWLTIAALAIAEKIPYRWTRPVGNVLGAMAYYLVPRIRKVGLSNLDLAYGDAITEREKRRILKRSAQNIAIVGIRFPHSKRFINGAALPVSTKGIEIVDVKRGGLLVTAHLGNWEYLSVLTKPFGIRGGGIVRPFDNPRVNQAVDSVRRASGFATIPKDGAGTELINRIRNGEFVAVAIDQCPRENAVPTQFFGQRCWSTFAPALIAIRTKAPIYPAFVVEDHEGNYTLIVKPPIDCERTNNMRGDLVEISQKCQDVIEETIREYPEQWLWFHRRWKARPLLDAQWREKEERDRLRAANL